MHLAILVAIAPLAQPTLVDPALDLEHVATGLGMDAQQQLSIGFVFVDEHTLLAPNRFDGTVRRLDLIDGQTATPGPLVLDLDIIAPAITDSQTEYGVQAIALHPDFQSNHYVYLRYDKSLAVGRDTPQADVVLGPNFNASLPTDNVIQRFIWDAAANDGDGALVFDQTIYTISFDTRYHHGGALVFDAGAHLYTAVGDLRHQPFVAGNFGNLLTTNIATGVPYDAAVTLRLNDDGSIPADNPFDVSDPDIPAEAAPWYAYGIRNSFCLTFDPATSNLWDTDNGEAQFDEVNLVAPGFNSGSLDIIGPVDHPGQKGDIDDLVELPGSSYSDPEFSWATTFGITAIHFLHGSALGPAYDDLALVGDVNNTYLFALPLNQTRDAFEFQTPALQDLVDDRPNSSGDPVNTEAEEIYFGVGFGDIKLGTIAITRGPDDLPYLLTGTGDLYRFIPGCVADFNKDGATNILDFVAYQSAFQDGHPGADCDDNGALNVLDFVCFQVAFQAGCN